MIRFAKDKDIPRIKELLLQVLTIHAKGRPDIFIANTTKYNDQELKKLINDDNTIIFVYDLDDKVVGYGICFYLSKTNNMKDTKTLYIDDLCVDENYRNKHIGKELYEHIYRYAKDNDVYNITLNAWAFNEKAINFYKSLGLNIMSYTMEDIIK